MRRVSKGRVSWGDGVMGSKTHMNLKAAAKAAHGKALKEIVRKHKARKAKREG